MIVELHVKNHTPADWQAVITGAAADFVSRDGSQSHDNKPGINIPTGSGEAVLFSANVECITQFTCHMSVRDRRGMFQIISRTFKDPLGRECVEEGQDCTLGQGPKSLVDRLGVDRDTDFYEINYGESK